MAVGEGLVTCKIAYKDFSFARKVVDLNILYSHKKPRKQTTPNSDNLGESYGCLNSGLLARACLHLRTLAMNG